MIAIARRATSVGLGPRLFRPQQLASVRSAGGNVVVLGDEKAYEALLKKEGKKVFYFSAVWCPPCTRIGPVIERLSKENAGTVTFAKVDIDHLEAAAASAGISAVPTFHFHNGQKRVSQMTGADESSLLAQVDQLKKL